MIKKGVISYISGSYANVGFPDEDFSVTAMLPLAKSIDATQVNVGDRCAVAFFEADYVNFADGVIIAIF